jgi:hypothetical protein
MTDQENTKLRELLQTIVAKITRGREHRMNEETTKMSLINPVLTAMGWDVQDWDEVRLEFRSKPGDNPVDYALAILGKPRLFIEAKGLGENLDDRKWVVQMLAYATAAGVVWCVLTDGDEYRFYNSMAPVDAQEKEFCRVRLSQANAGDAVNALALLSRGNLGGNLLEERWTVHFVDRRVKQALRDLVNPPDNGLISLIRRKAPQLARKEIIASFGRLDIRIDSATKTTETRPLTKPTDANTEVPPGKPGPPRQRQTVEGTLADLIGAGLLKPPLRLFFRYKGQELEATLLANGGVEFQGQRYASPSAAGAAARATITGRTMATDGWRCWQVEGTDDKPCTLADVRDAYLKS